LERFLLETCRSRSAAGSTLPRLARHTLRLKRERRGRLVQRQQAVDPRQVAAFKARLQALLAVKPGAIVGKSR